MSSTVAENGLENTNNLVEILVFSNYFYYLFESYYDYDS